MGGRQAPGPGTGTLKPRRHCSLNLFLFENIVDLFTRKVFECRPALTANQRENTVGAELQKIRLGGLCSSWAVIHLGTEQSQPNCLSHKNP